MNKKFYLLRNEGVFAFNNIATKLKLHKSKDVEFLNMLWNLYIDKLSQILYETLDEQVEIVIHDHLNLETKKEMLIKSMPIITLDSYNTNPKAIPLGVSRIFDHRGVKKLKIGARPGYKTLSAQIKDIKAKYATETRFTLVDDDIFSGGTMQEIIKLLNQYGITIKLVIVGTQIISDSHIQVPVEAVHKYKNKQVYELNDPRDFLMGSFEGGLVIKVNKNVFRVPYVWPFIDVAVRVGIPPEKIFSFSEQIVQLNKFVYQQIEEYVQRPVCINVFDENFTNYLQSKYGVAKESTVSMVCDIILEDLRLNQNDKR